MFQGLLIHHDVDSALVMGRKVSRDSLRQMCLDRQISFKTIYEVSNVVWEQVLQDDSRDKRRKMTHISRQDVDFGDSIQGQPIEKSYCYLEIRPDVRPTTKYLWPYDSSSRLHMARHFVEEHHDMVFKDLVPTKERDKGRAVGKSSVRGRGVGTSQEGGGAGEGGGAVGESSDKGRGAGATKEGGGEEEDETIPADGRWHLFQQDVMHISTKYLPSGNSCMLRPSEYRDWVKGAFGAETQTTREHLTLQHYTHRIAEFLEWVFRRSEGGSVVTVEGVEVFSPIFPIFHPTKIDSFLLHYASRDKRRSTLQHAYNKTTTANMVTEMKKALNAGAHWERIDLVWLHVITDDFPLTNFQFPQGWLPLTSEYRPASSDRANIIRRNLAQREAENISADYLPHPCMCVAHSEPSRSDVQALYEAFMSKDSLELLAQEAVTVQGILRQFDYNQLQLRDLEVRNVEQDRQSGSIKIRSTSFLHFTSRNGKGNSGGYKELGVLRNKILWACPILHLARLMYKRYVWSCEKMRPMLSVDWEDHSQWLTHRVAGHCGNDPSVPIPAQTTSKAISTSLQKVLGWDEDRVEQARKNGSNRRQGANNASKNGATGDDLDKQGNWNNSHSASQQATVREKHYMSVESNLSVMSAAAGFNIVKGEDPLDDARLKISFDSVSGLFFGDIIVVLERKLKEYLDTSIPADKASGMHKKTWQNRRARTCAAYRNMVGILTWFDTVLCQDLPILRHFYPDLDSWQNPVFEQDDWKSHSESAIRTYFHFTQHSSLQDSQLIPEWAKELSRKLNHIEHSLAVTVSSSQHVTAPVPSGCVPTSRPLTRTAPQPSLGRSYDIEHAFPTIDSIRLTGHGQKPFATFLHFWCGSPDNTPSLWHCTHHDLVQQHHNNISFHATLNSAMQRRFGRAKLVMEIIHNSACSRDKTSSDWDKSLDTMIVSSSSDRWQCLLTAAEQLDKHFGDASASNILNWDHYIDQMRPVKKRKVKSSTSNTGDPSVNFGVYSRLLQCWIATVGRCSACQYVCTNTHTLIPTCASHIHNLTTTISCSWCPRTTWFAWA